MLGRMPHWSMRWWVAACVLLASAVASDARASVSIAVTWDGLLHESTAAAVVVPVQTQSVWENGRIYTYTRVHVQRPVAGDLAMDAEPWVRTMGGVVGKIGQIVDGEPVLTRGQSSLLFLHPGPGTVLEVTARGQGQFPVIKDATASAKLVRNTSAGAVFPPRVAAGAAAPQLAADLVHGRALDDVARDVAAAWGRTHAQN
jgi:hypothetical protein